MQKLKISLEEAKQIQSRFVIIGLVSVVYILIGVFFMMQLEQLSFLDGMYFSVVSLTTVGYGDFSPQTDAGKIFVMIYLIIGIGIFAGLINNVVRSAMARRVIKQNEAKK